MRLTVFCGSSTGRSPTYAEAARGLGREMVRRGVGLVYGGAGVGLMGVLADTVLEGGGEVIGVIPQNLVAREIGHTGVTDLRVVESMHERKALMAELGDAFVALPGGVGTLDELFEAWTWAQLGLHLKPCAVLNVNGYFDSLLQLIEHTVREGFMRPEYGRTLIAEREPGALLDRVAAYKPLGEKWTVDALGWVRIENRRLLTVRTAGKDLFYLPGGKRELGESDLDALAREVREEVSVRLLPDTLVPLGTFRAPAHDYPPGTSVDLVCYTAEFEGEISPSSEIEEMAWMGPDDLERCAPAVRLVIGKLRERGEL
ncbi:MAG: hypothetical protein NVS1B3_00270 [Candidatus Dormibacteraceae bacterium]